MQLVDPHLAHIAQHGVRLRSAPVDHLAIHFQFAVLDVDQHGAIQIGLKRREADMLQLQRERHLQRVKLQGAAAVDHPLLIEAETCCERDRPSQRDMQILSRHLDIL